MIELSGQQTKKYAAPLVRQCMGDYLGDRFDEEFSEVVGDGTDLFGLFIDDALIAVAGLGAEFSPKKVWLGYFAVHPEFRGKGHGTRSLQFIEAVAAERGYEWIYIETYGSPTFDAAIHLYKKFGYWPVGELSEFLADGSDALYFRRKVG